MYSTSGNERCGACGKEARPYKKYRTFCRFCPERAEIWIRQCDCGSTALFTEWGYPWPIHECREIAEYRARRKRELGISPVRNRDVKPAVGERRDMTLVFHDYQSHGERVTLHDPIKEPGEPADSYTCVAERGVPINSSDRGKLFGVILVGQDNGMWRITEFNPLQEE